MTRYLLIAATFVLALALAGDAAAASWSLTWKNNDVYDSIELQRVPIASGNKCVWPADNADGTNTATFTTVPGTTTAFVDSAAPAGWLCYRARAFRSFDPGDGTAVQKNLAGYSNVDATKPGNITNVTVSRQAP